MNLRNRNMFLILALLLAVAVGIGLWLMQGGQRSGKVGVPDVSREDAERPEGTSRADREAKRITANREPDNAEPTGNGTEPGDGEEYNFPDRPEPPVWNPDDFANTRLPWRLPAARPDAQRPEFTKKYNGTPVFLGYADIFREEPQVYGASYFDPVQPDGMLVISVGFRTSDASMESRKAYVKDCVAEATSHDGASVYRYPEYQNGICFAVPYSYRRTETLGLRITGPNMLPAEAIIGQAGPSGMRERILTRGMAKPVLRVFPADYNDFREILVTDGDGNPVPNAMLNWDSAQILGRSDTSGVLRFPWPATRKKSTVYDNFFFLSAPGYVPVLLERSALEKAAGPVQVTLKARELLVSVHEMVPHPEVLKLGANLSRASSILNNGVDLIPLQDDYPAIEDWTDFHRALFGKNGQWYDNHLADGDLQKFPDFHAGGTAPYTPGHEYGGEGAEKLAQALGRQPTEHWPEYAHWYYGRWDYDEREGRFDVVLPFPGRFLLAVGEYNRGSKGELTSDPPERQRGINGQLTHVLYIDARDPANIKSKLLIHPLG